MNLVAFFAFSLPFPLYPPYSLSHFSFYTHFAHSLSFSFSFSFSALLISIDRLSVYLQEQSCRMNTLPSQLPPLPPVKPAVPPTPASPTSPRTRSQFYHSEPLPHSPSQDQFPTDNCNNNAHTNTHTTPNSTTTKTTTTTTTTATTTATGTSNPRSSSSLSEELLRSAPHTQQLPPIKSTRSSTGDLVTSPGNHHNRHATHGSFSLGDADAILRGHTGTDRTPIQFTKPEIEKSYQELLKRQPVANTGPSLFHSKTPRRPSKEAKQRTMLSPNPPSNIHDKQSHSQRPSKNSVSSNLSSSLSHSPIFGSPASEDAKRWIKTVGTDQPSDTESEHPESDQEAPEDKQQQWQIDYENDVAGQVELETEADMLPRKQPDTSSSSWFNMAGNHSSEDSVDSSCLIPASSGFA